MCRGVRVLELRPCTKEAVERIKEAEETKEKTYSVRQLVLGAVAIPHAGPDGTPTLHQQALCWSSRALAEGDVEALQSVKEREVLQDTPVRVLHRRAPKVGRHSLCTMARSY